MVIGAVLGVFLPGNDVLEMFGTLFVSALKGVAPILVFFLVISALANAKGAGAMKVVVILYLAATFIAAFVAVLMSSLFPVELTLTAAQDTSAAPSDIGSVFSKLLLSIASNPVDALTNANYLGILAWAVLLGIALRHAKDGVKEVFASISDAVSQVVRWIISWLRSASWAWCTPRSAPRAWRSSPSTVSFCWCFLPLWPWSPS